MKHAAKILATLALLIASLPLSAAELDLGACAVCHGTQGNGNVVVRAPRIGGMEPWYLERQLRAFRAGWRGMHEDDSTGHEMRAIAAWLQDDAAVSYAAQRVSGYEAKPAGTTIQGDVQRGKTLYEQCAACHGARGEGNAAIGAPRLAGNSDWYMVGQLENFRRGVRGTHEHDTFGAQMRAAASALPDAQAASDVIAYINTLR
jgi:cytochrome c oxidase subunit 2